MILPPLPAASRSATCCRRAAGTLAARMPPRPLAPTQRTVASSPYQTIAAQLREQIANGQLRPGDQLPAISKLAAAHGVSVGTAHRAVALLTAEGLVSVARGRRATVANAE